MHAAMHVAQRNSGSCMIQRNARANAVRWERGIFITMYTLMHLAAVPHSRYTMCAAYQIWHVCAPLLLL